MSNEKNMIELSLAQANAVSGGSTTSTGTVKWSINNPKPIKEPADNEQIED